MKLRLGHKYTGQAISIKPFGAILKLDDGSTHVLHISNISNDFVSNVADYIHIGEYYEVTAIPGQTKPIELTLKDVDVSEFYEDDNDDDISFDELLEQYLPKPDRRDRKIHRRYNKDK